MNCEGCRYACCGYAHIGDTAYGNSVLEEDCSCEDPRLEDWDGEGDCPCYKRDTVFVEVAVDMIAPDALTVILLLQQNGYEFEVSSFNPRVIAVKGDIDDITELMEDNLKEGWVTVTEE